MLKSLYSRSVIGLELQPNALTLTELRKHKNGFHLIQTKTISLLPGVIKNAHVENWDQFTISLRALVQEMGVSGMTTVMALHFAKVIRKRFKIKKTELDHQLQQRMNRELMRDFPANRDKWRLDYLVLNETYRHEIEILVVAAKEKDIDQYYQTVCRSGLKVKIIEIDLYALLRVFHYMRRDHMRSVTNVIIYEVNYTCFIICHDEFDILFAEHFTSHAQTLMSALQTHLDRILKNLLDLPSITLTICAFNISKAEINAHYSAFYVEEVDLQALLGLPNNLTLSAIKSHLFAFGMAMRASAKW